ncbi:MAG: hypothetical protein A3D92_21855 [Bacteroidetes bacterium RIFCSPHIGHO2_02_FULL_44_7]|nr:MAG: hypothetical protein A3D92_21855 [Bacteroidetes bacterium RIFCSPHIGHO2_02_FULL_44_7]
MIRLTEILIVLLAAVSIAACGTSRDLTDSESGTRRKQEQIISALDSLSSIKIDNFYSKVSTNYQDSSKNVSFKTSLRVVNDSAVSAIITYASIPVVNALITTDSVKISNRRDKCYILRDLAFFRDEFGIDFTFENVEELFLGKPVAYNAEEEYYKVSEDENTVCSHKKKDIRKNERKDHREIITYYTLNDSLTNLAKMQILSPEDSTMIQILYLEREFLEGFMLPAHIEVSIQAPRQNILVDFEYRKSHINRPEEVHFVIPENYEKCE